MRTRSLPLSVSFGLIALAYVALAATLAVLLSNWIGNRWLLVAATVVLVAPLLFWHVRHAFAPIHSLFRALAGTVASYRDGDFSFGLAWNGGGDLGDLVAAHGALGQALRDQRLALVERELLLDTMVQNT
ncbi:MAG TPA: ATP-binding protein, partial [Luteimonas sp.]|nr:ATP-binding protein [Luteimonas sp.]